MKAIPTVPEVAREAIIVLLGAIVAAFVVGNIPQLRVWIKSQWDGAPTSK